jgi:hypothetical protein
MAVAGWALDQVRLNMATSGFSNGLQDTERPKLAKS